MTALDPRLNAFRPDLADARLRGSVASERFASGEPATIAVPVANLHRHPDAASGLDTQLLLGDAVTVFDRSGGWAWLQNRADGYVGYVEEASLSQASPAFTHVVSAARSFIYPGPDLRLPANATLSMGSAVVAVGEVETRGTRYTLLEGGGAMIARHLRAASGKADDYVSVAEEFLNTPYLWGGTSAFGIDCSGLVQLSLRMTGRSVLRDTSMQETSVGQPLASDAGLQRGDLVFWKGHVAIMTGTSDMIHANGHTMTVAREGLHDAIQRIGYLYGQPTGFRRPD